MNDVELYINGVLMDADGVDIASTIAANRFQSIATRSGNYTNEISLPLTNNNLSAVEHLNQLNAGSDFDKRFAKAAIYEQGSIVVLGFCQLIDIQDNIKMRIFSGNADWITRLSGRLMSEIDLSDLDHTFNNATVNSLRNNTQGFVYPNAWYGAFARDEAKWSLSDFFPAVYYKEIITRIYKSIGLTVSGSLLDDELFNKSVVPFTNDKIVTRAEDYVFQIPLMDSNIPDSGSTITAVGPAVIYGLFPGIVAASNDPVGMLFPAVTTGTLADAAHVYISETHAGYVFFFDIEFTASTTGKFLIRLVDKSNGNVISDGSLAMVPGLNTGTIFIPASINQGTFVTVEFGADFDTSGVVSSISSTIRLESDRDYTFRGNCFPDTIMHMNQVLPQNIKQTDFLLHVFNQFSVLATADSVDNKVYLNKFDDVYSNIGNAIDITNFIDHSTKPRVEFKFGDYGQKNWYRYASDEKDLNLPLYYGDGFLSCQKQGIQAESDVFQSVFAAMVQTDIYIVSGSVTTYNLPSINIRNPRNVLKPKCGHIEISDDQNINMLGATPLSTNAGLFFDKHRFDNHLLPTYHKLEKKAIEDQRLYKLDLRLSKSQIQQISTGTTGMQFTVPLYADTVVDGVVVQGYFYINQITQYKHGKKESTEVELIRIA